MVVCTSCASCDCASRQNTESSSTRKLKGKRKRKGRKRKRASCDYSSGQNMGSTGGTTAQPLFGTSNTSSASTSASVLAELRSSASTSPKFGGFTFSFQNEGNALQQSNSNFWPSTVSLPPSSSFPFGTKTDNSNFNRAPGNYCFGVPTFSFGGMNVTGTGFNWNQSGFHSNSAHGSTSSTLAFAPLTSNFSNSNIFRADHVNSASGNKTIFGIQSSSGGRTTCGGQSSNAFYFKTSDTSPANSQSQAIVPQSNVASSMATCTPNLNSHSTLPFGPGESIFSIPGSRPFDSTFSSGKRSSTVHAAQPEQISVKVDSISTNNLSQPSQGKDCADKAPSLSLQFMKNSSRLEVTTDDSIHDTNAVLIEIHEPDVLSVMPKVPDEYYTEPSILELAAKERAEPGFCGRVKDFVVGRKGYGRVKFVGERDVRHLDLGHMIQFHKKK